MRSEKSGPSQLWRSVNELMGRGSSPASSTIAAVNFHRCMDDIYMCTLTTARSTASVDPGTPTVYGNMLLTVSLPSLIGCVPIDFSSMHPRRKYCGALQPIDEVSYLSIHWLLALISCSLSDACVISVFSLTLT